MSTATSTTSLTLSQAAEQYRGVCGCYGIFHRNMPDRPYVGQATDVGERFSKHLYDLRTGRHHCYGLERFFYFAKEEMFTAELLRECRPNQASRDRAAVHAEVPGRGELTNVR